MAVTYVLCGSHEPRIWCFLQNTIEGAVRRGVEVSRYSAADWNEGRVMGEVSPKARLVIIAGDPGYAVRGSVIVPEGGKVPAWADSGSVKTFDRPKPWDEESYAVKFCVEEAKHRGCVLSDAVAEMLVRRVGTDVCVIRRELMKLHTLMGSEEIDVDHIQEGVDGADETNRLVHALGMRDGDKIHRALSRMPKDVGKLLGVLGLLRVTLMMWLSASLHRSSGLGAQDIAQKLGIHPYRYTKQVQPYLMGWNEGRVVDLMRALGGVERGCKEGAHVAPWVEFEAILFRSVVMR